MSEELASVRAEKLAIEKQVLAAEKSALRAAVTAPVDGVVTQIHSVTSGSAVRPFEPLIDIVPAKESLVVEARIRPIDVDEVHLGQEARLVLSSFNRNKVDPLNGTVTFLSADSRTDERTGETYYAARLQVTDIEPVKDLSLNAGMPVESFITTGKQSFLGYLVSPFTDSFARAFRS